MNHQNVFILNVIETTSQGSFIMLRINKFTFCSIVKGKREPKELDKKSLEPRIGNLLDNEQDLDMNLSQINNNHDTWSKV